MAQFADAPTARDDTVQLDEPRTRDVEIQWPQLDRCGIQGVQPNQSSPSDFIHSVRTLPNPTPSFNQVDERSSGQRLGYPPQGPADVDEWSTFCSQAITQQRPALAGDVDYWSTFDDQAVVQSWLESAGDIDNWSSFHFQVPSEAL